MSLRWFSDLLISIPYSLFLLFKDDGKYLGYTTVVFTHIVEDVEGQSEPLHWYLTGRFDYSS